MKKLFYLLFLLPLFSYAQYQKDGNNEIKITYSYTNHMEVEDSFIVYYKVINNKITYSKQLGNTLFDDQFHIDLLNAINKDFGDISYNDLLGFIELKTQYNIIFKQDESDN